MQLPDHLNAVVKGLFGDRAGVSLQNPGNVGHFLPRKIRQPRNAGGEALAALLPQLVEYPAQQGRGEFLRL